MQEIILIKNGELALKGLNRSSFESVLVKNIKRRMHGLGKFVITRSQSTLTIEPQDDSFDMEEAVDRLSRVFGIAGFERAANICATYSRAFTRSRSKRSGPTRRSR